jgi:uracil-DNA glycosylase
MDYIPFLLEPSWQKVMQEELKKTYMVHLAAFVAQERASLAPIYPPEELVFNALNHTPFDKVRVVIVGQDPYHGPGQAHGLSFSVPIGVPPPPSLQNIFKELASDLGVKPPNHGCLLKWAEQGVLLLNATLTVRDAEPLSHHKKGWERFTDAIIRELAKREEPIIFLLWGKNAIKKCEDVPELAKNTHHTILTAAHPSPFSANNGFFGCRHFSKTNEILEKQGSKPIDWTLDLPQLLKAAQ